METRDVILGIVCVERGWLSPEMLDDCRRESAALLRDSPAPGSTSPLSRVLVQRRLIPEDELLAIRAEISKALWRGTDFPLDREEDLELCQFLRDAGQLSKEHLEEALALQKDLEQRGVLLRLGEILLEKGFVTFSALQASDHARRIPGTPVTCRSCKTTSAVVGYDPGRVYLCKACTGELIPTAALVSEPPPEAVQPGTQAESEFGRYGSPVEIGRGGMGVVYKAWDEIHDRWVALKVIKDTGHLEELTRFRREVEIAHALHHPNIVALFEVTQVGSKHLIAMEYVDGETLAGKRLNPNRAAEIVALVARAVQYAHSRGIVHRDIKPQNIMIDRSGKPYLMDFGLAKSLERPSSITSVGTAMGTPYYMAPEQAIGRTSRVDRRSDVYSLGAVLYDLVTGRPPFRGANPLDTLSKVVYENVAPPTVVNPDVPGALERIILRCMEKDKNSRYQTARHLAEDLERFLSSESS
jgi:predicted Ser/Thr protein kinase